MLTPYVLSRQLILKALMGIYLMIIRYIQREREREQGERERKRKRFRFLAVSAIHLLCEVQLSSAHISLLNIPLDSDINS